MTTQTQTLADFLLARIAEDEDAARGAIDPERPGAAWHWVTTETDVPVTPGDEAEALSEQGLSLRTVDEFPTRSVGDLPAFLIHSVEEGEPGALAHIARHDPARVLAECEAKRRIVEEHGNDYGDCATCSDGDDGACGDPECCGPASAVMKDWPCPTLRALALPYADHEEFQEAWRV